MTNSSRLVSDRVYNILLKGPESGAVVTQLAGFSQATFSRTVQELRAKLGDSMLVLPKVGGLELLCMG